LQRIYSTITGDRSPESQYNDMVTIAWIEDSAVD
jgi:hypothetical protein